ncbi:hypothetical protein [Streptomyces sp. CC224B]|uniref:hypothetical protein n=1 Tax=Streptomyces sp. CC224B TaxID=3044571 RepID=UPI0024A7B081|nr:hypothetical protein [Streptomyces sp. CC224B]
MNARMLTAVVAVSSALLVAVAYAVHTAGASDVQAATVVVAVFAVILTALALALTGLRTQE